MKVFTIARLTFLEARRRWLFWAVILIGLVCLALYATGFYFAYRDFSRYARNEVRQVLEPTNFFLLAGLYVVNFLTVVLAVLTSVDTIAGEIGSGTIHTIVTKPLQRWEVALGKWVGFAIMLSGFAIIMSAGILAIVWFIAHYVPSNPIQGIALIVLGGLVMLTLSILGSTRLSTLTNGVVVFMLYGVAFIAGWIEQFGAFFHNATAVDIGIVVSLLIPSEAMWKRAAYLMQPPFLRELGLGVTPFGSASAPSEVMVGYTIGYVIVLLICALYSFQKRDL